jgi:hypothetical protein
MTGTVVPSQFVRSLFSAIRNTLETIQEQHSPLRLLEILSYVPIVTGEIPSRAMTRQSLTPMCIHGASIGTDTSQHGAARPSIDANREAAGPALIGI